MSNILLHESNVREGLSTLAYYIKLFMLIQSRAARSAVRDLSLVRLMRAFIFLVHSQKGPIVQIRTFYDLLIFYGTFISYVRNLNEID